MSGQSDRIKSINPLNEEPMNETPDDEVETETPKHESRSLNEWLASCKGTEPALGLEYIVEYRSRNNSPTIYHCKLCECEAGLTNMFMHVGGAKHRLAYLKKHHPAIANSSAIRGKGSELSKRLSQIAMEIEKREGRKKIETVMDYQGWKRKYEDGGHYDADSKIAKIDFTSDEVDGSFTEKVSPPPTKQATPENLSFQELKEAYAEMVKLLPESKITEKEMSDKNMTHKKSGDQIIQEQNESDPTSTDFTSNKELLDYVQNFKISCNDDAVFVLKVTQKFTDALIKYREKVKNDADSNSTTNDPEDKVSSNPIGKVMDSSTQKKASIQARKNLSCPTPIVYTGQPVKYNISQEAQSPQNTTTTPSAKASTSDMNKNVLSSIFSAASKKPLDQGSQTHTEQISSSPSQGLLSNQKPSTSSNSDISRSIPLAFPNASKDKNEAMLEFFNSIKHMEISEVTATLNKIASTNPAFKGIDVSNVIRILVESGRLKSTSGSAVD
ncbi:uncharacterized protein LOC115084722 isoform X2 [Rhinatrema bivittatum]|uniref:uncharacterized protein LOC115084722 isoform X2 n=1 Tax=Rhinatrema bivittatum TaxID=194408 RepID=UPI001126768A|nr:uncharacterized protein LOC115084722 isoform X2 [Rhinatrema bivittatum]